MNIRNWPTNSPVAAEALERIYDTHCVFPLKAYDINGDLILPLEYKTKLRNALVRIEFTMSHWVIRKKKAATDTFVADILSIRVLDEPRPLEIVSPKKGAVRMRDPMESDEEDTPQAGPSPSKRGKRK